MTQPQRGTAEKPITDEYSYLTDERYDELQAKMLIAYIAWDIKENEACALLYKTLSDNVFIESSDTATVADAWTKVCNMHTKKSALYSNVICSHM